MWLHSYAIPRIVRFTETEVRRLAVQDWWAGGAGTLVFNRQGVSVWKTEKVLEMDGSVVGSTNMQMFFMPLIGHVGKCQC